MAGFLMTLLSIVGVFLMFIILLQRGRGGGLAGAFGGAGGQSAFGTRAGDVFTRITVGLVVVWVILAGATGFAMRSESNSRFKGGADAGKDSPEVSRAGGKLIEEPKEKKTDDAASDDKTPDDKTSDDKSQEGKAADDKKTGDTPDAAESSKPKDGDSDAKPSDSEKPAAKKPDAEEKSDAPKPDAPKDDDTKEDKPKDE